MKTPNVESATVTARVISRMMRRAGFQMADTSDRFRWTEGYHVSRVGCSNMVSIDYHVEGHYLPLKPEQVARRQEARAKLDAWLKERGYEREQGTGYIKCKRPD